MNKNKSRFRKFLYSDNTVGHVFSAPFIIGFLLFTIIPIIISFYYSFTDYNIISEPSFIGIDNYINLTKDSRFINSVKVTLKYVVTSVPLKLIFALFVAMLLVKDRRGVTVYRSVYYLPSLIGGSIAVALVWKEIFSRQGVINEFLSILGIESLNWFGVPKLAMIPLILMAVWQFGSSMLIFIAGLKNIPVSYYEAAKIDGASGVQSFFYITLPSLSPIILYNLIMQTISSFMTFTQAFVITGGGPNDATNFYALYGYNQAFSYRNMGYACSMSWIMLVVISIVTLIIFRTSKYWVFYESEY